MKIENVSKADILRTARELLGEVERRYRFRRPVKFEVLEDEASVRLLEQKLPVRFDAPAVNDTSVDEDGREVSTIYVAIPILKEFARRFARGKEEKYLKFVLLHECYHLLTTRPFLEERAKQPSDEERAEISAIEEEFVNQLLANDYPELEEFI